METLTDVLFVLAGLSLLAAVIVSVVATRRIRSRIHESEEGGDGRG